jgi:hypothetical protein
MKMNNQTTKIKVPAGQLRIDGATYQHREALKANGWKWEGRGGSAWYRTTTTTMTMPIRSGCWLCIVSPERNKLGNFVFTLVYDTAARPTSSREDFDTYDMV